MSVPFDNHRVATVLQTLESMAAGQVDARLPVSPRHDALDAIAFGINTLVGELTIRAKDAEDARAAELRAAVATAEARNSAMLHAIPDLMFVLRRDRTYVDYHARDPKSLFVPPDKFLGRHVREVLPPALAGQIVEALERASQSDDPIVIQYELLMGEPRVFETRIVRAGGDRLLSIVRDVTEARRASQRIHDLAERLVASQEMERQRIARELHDDISQRMALLNLELDDIAAQADEQQSVRLRALSAEASEIARAVHDLSYKLHPSRLQALGLVAAIQSLCQDAKQRHVDVVFTPTALPASVDANVSLTLYRIAQEALHNVTRHSRARDAQVSLTYEAGHVGLQIADSGVGFDPKNVPSAGLGLVSMQERVAVLNGQVAIDAAPGRGTRIEVRIPVGSETTGATAPLAAAT
jgi:signal transduction histidine kinase